MKNKKVFLVKDSAGNIFLVLEDRKTILYTCRRRTNYDARLEAINYLSSFSLVGVELIDELEDRKNK